MATIRWTLNIENRQHIVLLKHGYWIGKREIWVDNVLVEKKSILVDYGSRHYFTIEGKEFELRIVTNGITYSYFLIQNGTPIPSDKDRKKGKTSFDLIQTKYLRDLPLWNDLSRLLEIPYIPDPDSMWFFRHRLIGIWKGYLVKINKGINSQLNREGWAIHVRHAPFIISDQGDHIRSDERILSLLGRWKKQKNVFQSEPGYTVILLPTKKNETPDKLAIRIQTFLSVVSSFAQPINQEECENRNCHRRFGQEVKPVLINGVPQFLCQDCINELPTLGQKAKEAYQQAPVNLVPGLIASSGIVFLGAVGWAAVAILLNRVAAVISALILAGIIREMDKVETKRSAITLLIATFLTVISVTLGNLLNVFLVLIRESFPLVPGTVGTAWNILFAEKSNLVLSYIMTLIGAGLYFLQFLNEHRKSAKEAFQPQVEILPLHTKWVSFLNLKKG